MKLRTPGTRKAISLIAALTATVAVTATIFTPASFGSNRHKLALWETDPIILAVPPTVAPGTTVNCAVEFQHEESPEPEDMRLKAAVSDTKHVTIYSDPVGAISYSGTVSGSSVVIPMNVSSSAAPGPVTVYCESDGSDPVSARTTVVSN